MWSVQDVWFRPQWWAAEARVDNACWRTGFQGKENQDRVEPDRVFEKVMCDCGYCSREEN